MSPLSFSEEKEKNMNYKESFVIYESVYAQFERMLKKESRIHRLSYPHNIEIPMFGGYNPQ